MTCKAVEQPEVTKMVQGMTEAELLALPASVDLATAGRAFRMGRTKAYELARQGQFPVRVLPCGSKFVVPKRAILEALGIDPSATANREPQPAA
jgi:hypothetical protein